MAKTLLFITILIGIEAIASGARADLIVNGDFSADNAGFTSEYNFLASGTSKQPGSFATRTDPHLFNTDLASFGDHTTGTGKMMVVDGDLAGVLVVWTERLAVMPNTEYHFSAWAASTFETDPAILRFTANDEVLGEDAFLPSETGSWQNFSATWNSGARTQVDLRIFDLRAKSLGNDFALDDISFNGPAGASTTPEPASVLSFVSGVPLVGWLALRARRRRQTSARTADA